MFGDALILAMFYCYILQAYCAVRISLMYLALTTVLKYFITAGIKLFLKFLNDYIGPNEGWYKLHTNRDIPFQYGFGKQFIAVGI